MCGCAGAGAPPTGRAARMMTPPPQSNGECGYTVELLQGWFTRFLNVKNTNSVDLIGITYPQLNSYLGYIQSALNYSSDPCYFDKELAPIVQVINRMTEHGL